MLLALLAVGTVLGDAGTGSGSAGAADAGVSSARFGAEIYGSCPVAGDAPPAAPVGPYQADGGVSWLLPHPRGPRLSCLLEACETDRALKEARADSNEKFVIGFSVGATAAAAILTTLFAVERLAH